ncbi:MAG TPA: hypothetical protein GXZ85_08100, partial [Firmicutes bacterium]|nr:hypothetical protein [Bacillota bacterium]
RLLGLGSIAARGAKFQLKFLEGLAIDANTYAQLHTKYRGRISYRHGRVGQLLVEKDKQDDKALAFLAEVLSACVSE